jgi:hypothetical protein
VTLPADLLVLCLVIVGAVGFRRRRGWPFAVAALIAALLLVKGLVQLPSVSWRLGVLDVALAGLIVLLAADVQGLPPSIAHRVRFGYRSHEWEFDDRLHLHKEALDRILTSYPDGEDWATYTSWKARAIPRGLSTLRRMRAMNAPDANWQSVRDDYVALYEGILAGIAHDQPPDNKYTLRVGQEIKERADSLRVEYRASARALMGGPRSRR